MEILWFRRDLRTDDNGLLAAGAQNALPIFIFDPALLDPLARDDRRVAFIFQQVMELRKSIPLLLFYGKPEAVFALLVRHGAARVYAAQDYHAAALERDRKIRELLPFVPVTDTYLVPFHTLRNKQGEPYRVFTPFFNECLRRFTPETAEARPFRTRFAPPPEPFREEGIYLVEEGRVRRLPAAPESLGFRNVPLPDWLEPDPEKAWKRFDPEGYPSRRDFPALEAGSGLAPHLRFGTISIRRLLRDLDPDRHRTFLSELYWRDFFAYLFYHFPGSETAHFQPLEVEWADDRSGLERWKNGETGVPLVDAGMRQLAQTGTMHNRVRMVAASFLVKNLGIDWREGEKHFASLLMDYDPSSNVGNWQWAAGTGADAQPYFRTFNPYSQGKKFDPEGEYIRRWVPELAHLSGKELHAPAKLASALKPGYPEPMADVGETGKNAKLRYRRKH